MYCGEEEREEGWRGGGRKRREGLVLDDELCSCEQAIVEGRKEETGMRGGGGGGRKRREGLVLDGQNRE